MWQRPATEVARALPTVLPPLMLSHVTLPQIAFKTFQVLDGLQYPADERTKQIVAADEIRAPLAGISVQQTGCD